ncbi:hypothetical protein [Capnocytophaga sputigena]
MDNDKLKITYEKRKIHFWYIIAILVAIIIFLIVSNFGNNTELVGYVSFAATIASIFLAVISIIYAFYSNSQLSQTLGKLDNSSQSLEKTAHSLDRSSQKVGDISEQLSSEIQKLNETINSIPKSMESVEKKVEETNSYIQTLYSNTEIKVENRENSRNINIPQLLLENSPSIGVVFSLYISYLSFKNKKIVKKNCNIEIIEKNYVYFYACIDTFKALNVLKKDSEIKNDKGFLITELSKEAEEIVENYICPDINKRVNNKNDILFHLKSRVKSLQEYFK